MQDTQNLNQALGEALGIEVPAAEEQPTTTEPVDNPTEPEKAPEATQPPQNDNSTIKQMRETIKQTKESEAKLKALLERAAKYNGTTVEELEQKIQAEEDKKNAQLKGIPTEVEARIREQEKRIRELEERNIAQDFNYRANNLIRNYNMTNEQFIQFAQSAKDQGFDVTRPGLNLDLLYKSFNFDTLMSQHAEKVKQDLLSEMQRQRDNSSSNPNVKGAVPNPESRSSSNDISSEEFINDLVAKLNK